MESEKDRELWKLAKKRVGFKRHLAAYVIINSFLWAMWYFTEYRHGEWGGIPWPVFSTLGWGIGVMFNFLGAYVFTKHNAVEREYEKLKRS